MTGALTNLQGETMTKPDETFDTMAQLAGELNQVAVASQAAAIQLLAAEMQALAHLMPGVTGAALPPSHTDAEIEADFDNMPV